MNNKGFTLIELMVTIILLSIVMVVAATSVIHYIEVSEEKSNKILIENIKISAENYYNECDSSSIIGNTTIPCVIKNNNELTLSVENLVDYGFLKVKYINGTKLNFEDIKCCELKIKKNVTNGKVESKYENINNTCGSTTCPEIK